MLRRGGAAGSADSSVMCEAYACFSVLILRVLEGFELQLECRGECMGFMDRA